MKRFLTTTTALSVALSGIPTFPLLAQTQVQVGDQVVICLPDASVACPDGASCVIIPEAPCDPETVEIAAQAAAAEVAAQEAAAAAEVAAQEAAAAEAAAQEAAAAAETAAQDAAAAEAAAAELAAQDAAAAEAAAAEVAAQAAATEAAAAEVAAQAAAAEAAAAEVAAQEAAAVEAAAVEVAAQAAAAEAAAAELAAQEAAAAEAAAAEVATQDAAAAEAAAAEVATQDAAAAEAAAAEVATQDAAAAEAAAAELAAQDAAAADAAALLDVVETAPVASEAAVEQLTNILTGTDDGDTVAPVAAAAIAAAALAAAASGGGADSDGTAPDATAALTATTVTEVTAEDSRSSAEEFVDTSVAATAAATAAPTESEKKKGLSDLEKFGLVALGVLAVGAVLSNGNKVVSNTGDRVVVLGDDGRYQVLKDDDTLIRRPGSTVRTESYEDGSTRSIVERDDGSRIITIRDASGRVLRRSRINPDGREVLLIDDLVPVERIDVATLPKPLPGRYVVSTQDEDAALRAALLEVENRDLGRSFSLRQIRDYPQVRALAPTIDVENVTFETGSAAIRSAEAQKLARLGRLMADLVEQNPGEMFLIEGHTDAVGSEAFNLALSDQRAESLALALSEYFGVPPENMVVQGYGETELRINTLGNEPLNRRAAVRIITPLLQRLATR